jgi:CRP/FNR family transcriptional regulator, cyclic AMP receptor protein
MARYTAPPDLHSALEQHCEKVRKPRTTVLFRRGQKAFGMFLVLSGTVRLDFGVDGSAALASTYGVGALVGLPATLTGRDYSMTATVTDDAELGFLTTQALDTLLRNHPEFCQQLLTILSVKIAHTEQVTKALLRKEKLPSLESGIA